MLLHLVHDAKLGRNHRWFHCFGDEDGMNWLKRYFAVDLFFEDGMYFGSGFQTLIPFLYLVALGFQSVHGRSHIFSSVPTIGALEIWKIGMVSNCELASSFSIHGEAICFMIPWLKRLFWSTIRSCIESTSYCQSSICFEYDKAAATGVEAQDKTESCLKCRCFKILN